MLTWKLLVKEAKDAKIVEENVKEPKDAKILANIQSKFPNKFTISQIHMLELAQRSHISHKKNTYFPHTHTHIERERERDKNHSFYPC